MDRPCATPGCPNTVTGRAQYCLDCQITRRRERDRQYKAANRGRIHYGYHHNGQSKPATGYEWLHKIAADNQRARDAGLNYGQYYGDGATREE